MKKKLVRLFLIVILVIIIFSISIVYGEKQIDPVFLSTTQVEENGTFDIGVDMSQWEEKKITIHIQTDKQLEQPKVLEDNEMTPIDSIYQEKEITIQEIKNIGVVLIRYSVPKEMKVGEQIDLTVTIFEEEEVLYTKQLEITVIEKEEEKEIEFDNKEEKQDKNNQEQEKEEVVEKQETNRKNTLTESQDTKSSIQTKDQMTQTIIYAGSCNNYLTSLTVNGEEIAFNKTQNTYFISIEKEQTSIEVSYQTEESVTKVCIYGNTDLQEGLNKVLITVTAEDGSVRNYRIYVTRGEV